MATVSLTGHGFQVLPNGIAWLPNLVKTITDVIMNGGKSILVDQKLIDGPNPNDRGKFFIPLILAFQVSFSSHREEYLLSGVVYLKLIPGIASSFSISSL